RDARRGGTRNWASAAAGGWRWGGAGGCSRGGGRRAGSGPRAHGRVPPDDRTAVPLAQDPQLRELRLVQRFVTVCQIQHRVVEPFLLVLDAGFQHAASEAVGEQFVAGLLGWAGGGRASGVRALLGRA